MLLFRAFAYLCLCAVLVVASDESSNEVRSRRRLHPTGKREVFLETPIDSGRFDSTEGFHGFLVKHGFRMAHEKVSSAGDGVMVLLSEPQIRDLAEDDYDHERESRGVMRLGDIRVRFLDEQEAGQERYIKIASNTSYICLDDAQTCGGRNISEFYLSYQRPDAIYYRLDNLMKEYGDYVRKSSMGQTYEGREQVYYTLTNYKKQGWENNPIVFYLCGTHPRELIPSMTCPWIIENLLLQERDGSTSLFNTSSNNGLLDEVQFIVLPIFNVDGFYYVHSVDEDILKLQSAMEAGSLGTDENVELWRRYEKAKMHRKSMAPNTVRCNAASSWTDIGVHVEDIQQFPPFNQTYCIEQYFGVDLNRNFPSHWMGVGAFSSIFADSYGGLYAGDQVETQNYMRFIQELNGNGTVLTATDVHCCADMWLMPSGWYPCKKYAEDGTDCLETYGENLDTPVSLKWGKAITDAIFNVNGNKFKYGPITTTIYPAAGSGIDWVYDNFGTVYLGAPEIHRDPSWVNETQMYMFGASNDQILPGIKEVYAGMVAGVQFALDNPNLRITDIDSFPTPLPGYPVEYICDHVQAEGICDKDCTNIDLFPFDVKGRQTPVDPQSIIVDVLPAQNDAAINLLINEQAIKPNSFPVLKGTGVDPCGYYLQSVEEGKASYVSVQPSTLFREICPQQCQDVMPTSEQTSNSTSAGDQDSASTTNQNSTAAEKGGASSGAALVTKTLFGLLASAVVSVLSI